MYCVHYCRRPAADGNSQSILQAGKRTQAVPVLQGEGAPGLPGSFTDSQAAVALAATNPEGLFVRVCSAGKLQCWHSISPEAGAGQPAAGLHAHVPSNPASMP